MVGKIVSRAAKPPAMEELDVTARDILRGISILRMLAREAGTKDAELKERARISDERPRNTNSQYLLYNMDRALPRCWYLSWRAELCRIPTVRQLQCHHGTDVRG